MRGDVSCLSKLSVLFFGIMVAISSSLASAQGSIPAGFEALSLGQDELLNVSFHGENEGVFTVFVTPKSLTFRDPNALFTKLHLDEISKDIRKKILLNLAAPISRHDEAFRFSPGDNIGVIYNEQEQSAMLMITPDWVRNDDQHFFHPSYNAKKAFVSHQSLAFSHDRYMESLGGTGYFAQGVNDSSYIQGGWTLFQNTGKNMPSSSQFQFSNLYLRSDMTPRTYTQVGRVDMTNLNSKLGGDFSLSLLPLSQIEGVRIGSTNAYINTKNIDTTGTPLTVMLTQPARVDIYRSGQLLGSRYLDAGIHDIDTSNLPAGAYPVLLKIFQNGKLIRQETQFFENNNQSQFTAGHLQWFFQIGKQNTSNNYTDSLHVTNENKKETQFAGGIQVGLSHNINLTTALMGGRTGKVFSENDLAWALPTKAGLWSLKSSYLMKDRKSIADSEQLSWSYNNHEVYLSRYNTFCKNLLSCTNNYNATASTSRYGWTASLGYNYSHSTQRFLQPLQYDEVITSYEKQSTQQNQALSPNSSKYVTSGVLLTLGTSTNYQGWNIWPRVGGFSNRSDGGGNDHGFFLTVSLSKNAQSSSTFSHNTTATVNYRQNSQDNNMSLDQQLVWNGQDYRTLEATLSGGERDKSSLVSTEWDGSRGNAGASIGYVRSPQYINKTINGHYDSTLAISSTGLVWGNGGGDESTLSGVIIDAKNSESDDITGPIAKVTTMQGGDAYIKSGHQTFIPIMDYMSNEINIEGSSVRGGNGNLTQGEGKLDLFLLPGHVSVDHLRANAIYIYVGRLHVDGENLLAGGHALNADVPDINPDGSFVAELNSSPNALYVSKNKQIYSCPLKYKEGFNKIRRVGLVSCQQISTTDLPPQIRKSERLVKLTSTIQ